MSNFPLSYRLSWLPRFLKPSLAGKGTAFAPASGRLLQEARTARLVFLGDISAVASRKPPEIDPALRDIIASADLVIGNCESPVIGRPNSPLATRLGARHAMTPAFLDAIVEAIGVDPRRLVVSLANNHVLDQGVAGFEETLAAFAARGIRTIGTAADGLVKRVEAGPLTVGFIAFTQWRNAGAAAFAGRVAMLEDVSGWAGEAGQGVDLVCAAPHWDWEFRHFPSAATRQLARELAAKGVGLIVGHHAHVVQPVELIGKTLAAYGLGDFLGTALSRQPWPGRIGAMLAVDVSTAASTRGQIAAYRAVPFMRVRSGDHERLSAIEALEGRMGAKVRQRVDTVFGGYSGASERSSDFAGAGDIA